MNRDLKAIKSININASAAEVWNALTNPDKIKIYLFGTETLTDWKVGNTIVFQGEYNGQTYKDKGLVLKNEPNEELSYAYWSGFSGLEDKPENYSIVTYRIRNQGENQVEFTWTQAGFSTKEGQQHSQNGLGALLEQIKKVAEDN
jgi:uncharacterized protein YndB with AHSA1/START domain